MSPQNLIGLKVKLNYIKELLLDENCTNYMLSRLTQDLIITEKQIKELIINLKINSAGAVVFYSSEVNLKDYE